MVYHEVYAHHYITDLQVDCSYTFTLEVEENPVFRDDNSGNDTMVEYDINDAMPQNSMFWNFFSYIDVTALPPRPENLPYTATGYTRLDITNPGGDDLNLVASDSWYFRR